MKHVVNIIALVVLVVAVRDAHAQLIPGSAAEGLRSPREALVMREEWWVGGTLAGGLHSAFGTLDLTYVTSPLPEVPSAHARTDGGWGVSMTLAPTIEYRPYRSPVGAMFALGVEYSRLQSSSTVPITDLPYAYNATFQSTVTTFSVVASAFATWYPGSSGFMFMIGPTIEIPLSAQASVWQNERLADTMSVGDEPGFPETNIEFRPAISTETRIGFQVGGAFNMMTGLFGYTSQLLTPYVTLHIATPMMRDPTAWGTGSVRLGVIWRAGL